MNNILKLNNMKGYWIKILCVSLFACIIQSSCKKTDSGMTYTNPGWSLDSTGKYAYTMSAVVQISGTSNIEPKSNDEIAAFIGGECRGIGTFKSVGDKVLFFILIHGSSTEQGTVSFRYYSTEKSLLYTSLSTFSFAVDTNYGTIDSPYVISMSQMK